MIMVEVSVSLYQIVKRGAYKDPLGLLFRSHELNYLLHFEQIRQLTALKAIHNRILAEERKLLETGTMEHYLSSAY
ncbi:hypothetical protein Plhal710r2_c012g0053691 [Plasmopara halstedii]